MKSKNKILQMFSLEQNKDGILFLETAPMFVRIENLAKQLQTEVWLNLPPAKGNPKSYICLRNYWR